MKDQTDIREFLHRMADETGFTPVEPRPVVRKARRRLVLSAGGTLLTVAALVAGALVGANRLMTADRTPRPAEDPTVAPPSTRVGFIGLPPEGASPSTPTSGRLVLSFFGPDPGVGGKSGIWVYADGRIIAERDADLPYGANQYTTGYLEQRLTPEGVELLRSEVIRNGLVGIDPPPPGSDYVSRFTWIDVRVGDRLVRLERAKDERRLVARITDPGSWLPASAWADQEIRAYVPSGYGVCYGGQVSTDPSDLLSALPGPAERLLRARDLAPGVYGWTPGEDYCHEVTTDEARTLVDAFDDMGLKPGVARGLPETWKPRYALTYRVAAPGPIQTVQLWFEPILPHGEVTCTSCG
jgi:hypothetical protein